MSAPIVQGRALLRQRLVGLVFLVVIALLVQLSIAIYQKKFTTVADVTLLTDRAGNQLSVHADVKIRGLVVGEVRKITSNGSRARIDLALKPEELAKIPKNVEARLLPKTLFGEKEVSLVIPDLPQGEIADGDTITQDRSSTALETEEALNNLLPVLQSLKPEQLSITLNALSEALRGRGDRLGSNLALNAAYLRKLNPSLPTLARDMQGLADFTNSFANATPDFLQTIDNFSFSSRALVEERANLNAFLESTRGFATSATSIVRDNERNLIALARDSKAPLQLFASYSNFYPCLLRTLAFQNIEGERVFGGAQPGLHITLEQTRDKGPYSPGDEPKYLEDFNPGCYGLEGKPIIPFPSYYNPDDGYDDGAPPDSPGAGPGTSNAAFLTPLIGTPEAVRTPALPRGLTALDALLIGPMLDSV